MELLAPAGSLETAAAAFEYGADAVYAGMKCFSARADAQNFEHDELAVLLGMAHSNPVRPRKVYIALNTLIRQEELPRLHEELSILAQYRPDALIIQDAALLHYVRNFFPELPVHASTQMAIHNRAGMERCRELGFSRVISARELTLREISEMAAVPGIELEVFVHGALCYAYSGICLLSSVLNGHSGNRGDCSYVCRNCWKVNEAGGRTISPASCLMSMKDLALPDQISALRRLGVASLKIEGRKKSPLYVAAVTNYYRHLIDGDFQPGEREQAEQDIQAIFSRPWTKLFLNGEHATQVTDPATTGPRGTFAGTVGAVIPGTPDRLRFQLKNLTLEKHDGLQIEPEGRERPFGFPVSDIFAFQQGGLDKRERVFTANPATTIEVPLPPVHPEINPGQNIYCTSSQQVKKRYHWPSLRPALIRQRHPVDMELSLAPEVVTLKVSAENACFTGTLSQETHLSPAQNPPDANTGNLQKCLAKLGDTPFTAGTCTISNPGNLFLPASSLNELRRSCITALEAEIEKMRGAKMASLAEDDRKPLSSLQGGEQASAARRWVVKIDRPYALNLFTERDFAIIGEVIIDLDRLNSADPVEELAPLRRQLNGGSVLRLALPAIMRRHNWPELIRKLADAGYRHWQVANPGAITMLAEAGVTMEKDHITADWQMYVCNIAAARELLRQGVKRLCLAPDDTVENTLSLLAQTGQDAEVIIFQDTPLAVSAACANASINGACPGKRNCRFSEMLLTSRNGQQLIAVNNNCQSVFINARTLDRSALIPQFTRAGARWLRADFIWRNWTPAAIRAAWDKLTK